MASERTANNAASAKDGSRRDEILRVSESLIATTGLRTSVHDIAKAAGILTGSLYHHFASKDALLTELALRYQADLAEVNARGLARLDASDPATPRDRLIELCSQIAECAARNQAALQMSFFEAPSEDPDLVRALRPRSTQVHDSVTQTLRAGRWSNDIRPDLDVSVLADRMCQTMLHAGLDVIRHRSDTVDVARMLCRTMLDGLSAEPVNDDELDRSRAFAAADSAVRTWGAADGITPSDKVEHIHLAAKEVFARKSFEVTTLRDIAAVAGVNAATVYRTVGSTDELLESIMASFGLKSEAAAAAVMASDSTTAEKLDALSWIYINAVHHFPDEWKIQLTWMRRSAPGTSKPGYAFAQRMQQLADLISDGLDRRELRSSSDDIELVSRCVMDLLWIPENIIRERGTRAALLLSRESVLRGIAP